MTFFQKSIKYFSVPINVLAIQIYLLSITVTEIPIHQTEEIVYAREITICLNLYFIILQERFIAHYFQVFQCKPNCYTLSKRTITMQFNKNYM